MTIQKSNEKWPPFLTKVVGMRLDASHFSHYRRKKRQHNSKKEMPDPTLDTFMEPLYVNGNYAIDLERPIYYPRQDGFKRAILLLGIFLNFEII